MKKLALILAIAMIAAFTAAPAFAELNIGGSYRVTADSLDTGAADNQNFFQQRFRLPFTWTVNDNITGFLRTDWSENAYWGSGNMGNTDNIWVDYAWVKISQPMFDLTVGMQEVLLGNWSAFDSDQEGFTLGLNFSPVTVTLAYGKVSEAGSKADGGIYGDTDTYGAELKYATDAFTIGALYAQAINNIAGADTDLKGYGVFFNTSFGAVAVKGEIDLYSGEASTTNDYEGLNAFADAKFTASEQVSLGLAIYYADGNNSATKNQVSSVSGTGGSFTTFDYMGALAYDEGCYNWGTTLMQDGFDLSGADSGIIALKGYASFKASDAVTLHGVLGYATPEQNVTLDSKTYAIGSIDYAWMPNVTVSFGAAYIAPDYSDTTNDDPLVQYLARLGVNF